jgi:hypothetical protein
LKQLIKRPDSAHLQAKQALQERWRCVECSSNGYCFKKKNLDTGKDEHFNLEPKHISLWAAQLVLKDAVMAYPPCQIPEFDELLQSKSKKKSNTSRIANIAHSSESHVAVPPINVVCNFPSSNGGIVDPATPSSYKSKARIAPSPVRGVQPEDYNGSGLIAFLKWCQVKYKDDAFVGDVFEKLQIEGVGVDTFKAGITASTLKNECKIKFGDADRLVTSFPSWEEEVITFEFCIHETDWQQPPA